MSFNTYYPTVTRREKEILDKMFKGLNAREIGKELYISPLTVEKHKQRLLSKFNVKNSVQLAVLIERAGLLRTNESVAA